ncbi:Fur family transcriptional regulator [Desulfitibacter alkalitolerans]|uniref:Fur family transcriptional regulator n=1 Tax=Desulfitibacter alkalitolerans TaxID=264641 RepID=UPI000481F3BE|nr:Fur family transcriptional regulator [Desulfitibacter alkalitolerans]
MNTLFKNLSNELINKNVRPSHQRMMVLDYLVKNQCHPTVEQIFNDLKSKLPTLSKSTVYNILNLFLEAGLIKTVVGEDQEARYDIITESHGHFKCITCETIYNFNVNIDDFTSDDLKEFHIASKDVYFKGTCPRCLSNKNKLKGEYL